MLGLPVLTASEVTDVPTAWPITGHALLGHGVIQDFVRDGVESPSGEVMVRDYLVHTGAVGVIAVDAEERVLVVRQYRHPVGFTLLEPPAGLLDVSGEGWLLAAQRELAEEAQVAASDWQVLVDQFNSPGCCQESLRIYLARGLSPAPHPEGFVPDGEEAHMEVALVALDDLVDAILAGRCQNPTLVSGVLAAHTVLRGGRADALRPADAPWPARDAKHARDAALAGFAGRPDQADAGSETEPDAGQRG